MAVTPDGQPPLPRDRHAGRSASRRWAIDPAHAARSPAAPSRRRRPTRYAEAAVATSVAGDALWAPSADGTAAAPERIRQFSIGAAGRARAARAARRRLRRRPAPTRDARRQPRRATLYLGQDGTVGEWTVGARRRAAPSRERRRRRRSAACERRHRPAPSQAPVAVVRRRARGRRPGDDVRRERARRDPDGTIARYDWDFGDGTSAAERRPDAEPRLRDRRARATVDADRDRRRRHLDRAAVDRHADAAKRRPVGARRPARVTIAAAAAPAAAARRDAAPAPGPLGDRRRRARHDPRPRAAAAAATCYDRASLDRDPARLAHRRAQGPRADHRRGRRAHRPRRSPRSSTTGSSRPADEGLQADPEATPRRRLVRRLRAAQRGRDALASRRGGPRAEPVAARAVRRQAQAQQAQGAPPVGQRQRQLPHRRQALVGDRPRHVVARRGPLRRHAHARARSAASTCATSACARRSGCAPRRGARPTSPRRPERAAPAPRRRTQRGRSLARPPRVVRRLRVRPRSAGR